MKKLIIIFSVVPLLILSIYNNKLTKEIEKLKVLNTNLVFNETSLDKETLLLIKQVEDLEDKLINEEDIGDNYYITGIPTINQYPYYPTGCESVAVTILLNYYKVLVNPDSIIDKLNKKEIPYIKDNKLYGYNPEKYFIGDPYNNNSYGVYEKPIIKIANLYKDGIVDISGTDLEDILKIVRKGIPVMVWTSINLKVPYISKSWIDIETGNTIYWKANEHAVVVIGYTNDKIIISDPIDGKIKYQSKDIFIDRYNYYGKRAIYYEK